MKMWILLPAGRNILVVQLKDGPLFCQNLQSFCIIIRLTQAPLSIKEIVLTGMGKMIQPWHFRALKIMKA